MNNLSLVRWAGGKGKQLTDLLPLIPPGHLYVEPFGGGASVLLNKPRSPVEVYNDLDEGLVNLFEVMRDEEMFGRFHKQITLTLYSRVFFERALEWEAWDDPVRRAVGFYTVLNQSISGKRLARKGDWSRGMQDNVASRWFGRHDSLALIHQRLRSVQIEMRDALDILQEWDGPKTVFYCDPPYVLDTRSNRKYYAVEQSDDFHERLVDVLLQVKGAVVLSGYDHPIYDRLTEHGWVSDGYGVTAIMEVVGKDTNKQDGKGKTQKGRRREVVWRNRRAAAHAIRNPMFDDHGTVLSGWDEEGDEEDEGDQKDGEEVVPSNEYL